MFFTERTNAESETSTSAFLKIHDMRSALVGAAVIACCAAVALAAIAAGPLGTVEVRRCSGLLCGDDQQCNTTQYKQLQCFTDGPNAIMLDCAKPAGLCVEAYTYSSASCNETDLIETREVVCDVCQYETRSTNGPRYFKPNCQFTGAGKELVNVTFCTDPQCKQCSTQAAFSRDKCSPTNIPWAFTKVHNYRACGFVGEFVWLNQQQCSGEPTIRAIAPEGGCNDGRRIRCI